MQELYKTIFDLSSEGIAIHNNEIIIEANKAFANIFGYHSVDELTGKAFINIHFPEKSQKQISQKLLKTEARYETEGIRVNGEPVYLECHSKQIHFKGENRRVVVVKDISENKKKLIESEENYKKLFMSAGDAALVFKDNVIIDCNKRAEKLLKAQREQIIGFSPWDTSPKKQPDGSNSAEKALKMIECAKLGVLYEFEWQHVNFNNELLDIEVTLSFLDTEKNIFIATWRDITAYKRAVKTLKVSEEKFSRIFYSSPDSITLTSVKTGQIVDVNKSFEKIFGYSRVEAIGKTTMMLGIWSKLTDRDQMITKLKGKRTIRDMELELCKKFGEIITCLLSGEFIEIEGEQFILAITKDITERKKSESLLIESEERNRMIIDNVPVVIWKTNADGITDFISDNVEWVYGYTPTEIYSNGKKYWLDRIHSDDMRHVEEAFRNLFEENIPFDIEYRIKTKQGDWIWLHDFANIVQEENGIDYALGVFHNITKQKEAQLALKESEQKIFRTMVSSEERERERYAKELHDGLGPLLSTSMIYLHTMLDEKNTETLKEYIERTYGLLKEAVQSIREISNNLSPDILKKFGIIQAVRSFIEKLKLVSKIDFVINSNLEYRLPETLEFTIYRTITELINNTIKYARAKKIDINIQYSEGNLNLSYSDDGVGFDYEKVKEKSRGFGLTNLENRILKLGGQYDYFSAPEKGTNVNIIIQTSCL